MNSFKEIQPKEYCENIFEQIGTNAMLITTGDEKHHNAMTASWGGLGVLWNKNVSFIFVRHSRYTFECLESESDNFALCFFGDKHPEVIKLCGTKSGRDVDKVQNSGLTPLFDFEAPYFEEADVVLFCKKIYSQDLDAKALQNSPFSTMYADDDYHRVYVGEIIRILKK